MASILNGIPLFGLYIEYFRSKVLLPVTLTGWNPSPGRGGQTEVTPDQTSFERTHVPGALELHGLEKSSSALLTGQWSGTCQIRGHFVLGRSDQRSLWSGTVWSEVTFVWDGLIRGSFKRTQVWSEADSSAHSLTRDQFERHFFSSFFLFSYWLLLSRVRDNNKTAFWSQLHLKIWWVWSEPRGPADNNCRFPQEKILNQSKSRRFDAELSKFIFSVKSIKKGILSNFFWSFFSIYFYYNTFRIGFLLVEYKIDKMIDEMNIL